MVGTRATLAAAAAAGIAALAGVSLLDSTAAGAQTVQRLRPFSSCAELLRYAKANAMPLVGPYGLGRAVALAAAAGSADRAARESAPAAGVDFSTTNVQEEGVDEPDIVKTDGRTLFAVAQGKLRAVDVRGARPVTADSLALEEGWTHELLLDGDRLLVLSQGAVAIEPVPMPGGGVARDSLMPYGRQETLLSEVDARNPRALRIVRTLKVDGAYVSARLVDGSIRVVVRSPMPNELPFVAPTSGDAAAQAEARTRNRSVVASSRAAGWLPRATVVNRRTGRRTTHSLVQCRHVMKPQSFSGLGTLTVLTIDLDRGLDPIDSDAVLTDGEIVYASPRSLYVATQRWLGRPDPARPAPVPEGYGTAVHLFDIADPERTHYRGSGEVPGVLLSQWSLSEHAGALRVASTDSPAWWMPTEPRESESRVTVLRPEAGKLVEVGRVGGLGRGERIYAVRFIGDVGYVVTFRQVDPLYTLDLSDPARPRLLGELKVRGYSAYLHPVGEDLLLGVGQDATDEGRVTGSQLSLFDVSDLRRPDRLHQQLIGPGSSEAEYDHHAFLYWMPRRLAVLPVQTYAAAEGDTWFGGVIAFRVDRAGGIQELGRVVHPLPDGVRGSDRYALTPIRRSVIARDQLLTVSEAGVRSSSLDTLADRGWVAFS